MNLHIILGITGGIAAYKSADLVRRLREKGAIVQVVMTENAQQFITPLTLQALSGRPVRTHLFDSAAEAAMGHIELARWADLIIVAPASADFIARLAHGQANDLLSTLCLATKAPLFLAPAMNRVMWENVFTQENIQKLLKNKIRMVGPTEGSQACGDLGLGRMQEPQEILKEIQAFFNTGLLAGKQVLITAGPTQEAIDPVRFLSNKSSGKMGYALAQAAMAVGAEVTLISGPVHIVEAVKRVEVTTAEEMLTAVMQHIDQCDIFLSVAAVADYRCKKIASQKIHKKVGSLNLELEPTTDILLEVGKRKTKPFIVGFAAETENLLINAKEKRMRKGMDVIIANQVGEGVGFESDDNAVTVLWQDQSIEFSRMPKQKLARELITLIAEIYTKRK